MSNIFQFKEFDLIQESGVFPLGTDTMLLGAWVRPETAETILDVGTGTGVLSLMMAQKSPATIEAIDINRDAVRLARRNIAQCRWAERIIVSQISLQELAGKADRKFDLILSNPPYFINSLKSKETHRATARHMDLLPLEDLLECSFQLLSPHGRLCLILPSEAANRFIARAQNHNLSLLRKTFIKPKADKPSNRLLLEFSPYSDKLREEAIVIRETTGEFTQDYIELTRDFHLPGALK